MPHLTASAITEDASGLDFLREVLTTPKAEPSRAGWAVGLRPARSQEHDGLGRDLDPAIGEEASRTPVPA